MALNSHASIRDTLDTERSYQEKKWNSGKKKHRHSAMTWVTLVREYNAIARTAYTQSIGDIPALHALRKLAALCVAGLEEHGVTSVDGQSLVMPVTRTNVYHQVFAVMDNNYRRAQLSPFKEVGDFLFGVDSQLAKNTSFDKIDAVKTLMRVLVLCFRCFELYKCPPRA